MKQVILDTAWEWTMAKPQSGMKIIKKIIEVLTVDKMMVTKEAEDQNQIKND